MSDAGDILRPKKAPLVDWCSNCERLKQRVKDLVSTLQDKNRLIDHNREVDHSLRARIAELEEHEKVVHHQRVEKALGGGEKGLMPFQPECCPKCGLPYTSSNDETKDGCCDSCFQAAQKPACAECTKKDERIAELEKLADDRNDTGNSLQMDNLISTARAEKAEADRDELARQIQIMAMVFTDAEMDRYRAALDKPKQSE